MVEPKIHSTQSGFSFRFSHLKNMRPTVNRTGTASMDGDSYCVEINRTLLGDEPEMVQAIAHGSTSGADEQMMGTMCSANELMANFYCAFALVRRELLMLQQRKDLASSQQLCCPVKKGPYCMSLRAKKRASLNLQAAMKINRWWTIWRSMP